MRTALTPECDPQQCATAILPPLWRCFSIPHTASESASGRCRVPHEIHISGNLHPPESRDQYPHRAHGNATRRMRSRARPIAPDSYLYNNYSSDRRLCLQLFQHSVDFEGRLPDRLRHRYRLEETVCPRVSPRGTHSVVPDAIARR